MFSNSVRLTHLSAVGLPCPYKIASYCILKMLLPCFPRSCMIGITAFHGATLVLRQHDMARTRLIFKSQAKVYMHIQISPCYTVVVFLFVFKQTNSNIWFYYIYFDLICVAWHILLTSPGSTMSNKMKYMHFLCSSEPNYSYQKDTFMWQIEVRDYKIFIVS